MITIVENYFASLTNYDWLVGILLCGFALMVLFDRLEWTEPSARAVRAPFVGEPIGCDYQAPHRHEQHYPDGAVHLCNSRCIHEPPEER